ncbi:Putative zinc-finger [Mariniphaga anaerophila]|uniref:Putative zinc-finger n=1 Tax=Mariniphaga anaerophila TaxID=1484053 RepID=A0A1M5CE33_9BACT|nr:zf-HC2 domain-containing protein [Mariniphaga anaerophila]SHF52926.1 Putative zinc-finger [Mariniphaga anaerophila]
MKCKTLHKKLIFFLEGDLPDKEQKEVREHLEHCADCAAFAQEMKKTLGILELEKSPEVTPFFYTRVKARLENQEEKAEERVGSPVWERVLQPVLFSLLLLAGIYGGFKIGEPAVPEYSPATYAKNELIPFLNDMQTEPLETFLMEQNNGN